MTRPKIVWKNGAARRLPEVGDVLYRARADVHWRANGGYDWNGEWQRSGPSTLEGVTVTYEEFFVAATTPHMMWITPQRWWQPWEEPLLLSDGAQTVEERLIHLWDTKRPGERRCRDARVMFAWPTKELALDSLHERTKHRLRRAKTALREAKAIRDYLQTLLPVSGKSFELRPPRQEDFSATRVQGSYPCRCPPTSRSGDPPVSVLDLTTTQQDEFVKAMRGFGVLAAPESDEGGEP